MNLIQKWKQRRERKEAEFKAMRRASAARHEAFITSNLETFSAMSHHDVDVAIREIARRLKNLEERA